MKHMEEGNSKEEFKKEAEPLPPDPYMDGFRSYESGKGITSCPYVSVKDEKATDFEQWARGWHDAREEWVRREGGGDFTAFIGGFYRTATDPRHITDSSEGAKNLGYESAESGGSNPYSYGSERWRLFKEGWEQKLSDLKKEKSEEFDLAKSERAKQQPRNDKGQFTEHRDDGTSRVWEQV